MVKLSALLCVLCLAAAAFKAVRPDAWHGFDSKVVEDANRIAALIDTPDRIGWQRAAQMGSKDAQHLIDHDFDLDVVTPDADEWKYEKKLF